MSASTVIPAEADLKDALVALRASNPTLGVPKIHALLLSTHPSWTVSEKRTRKVLQNEGLIMTGAHKDTIMIKIYPSSSVIEGLDVKKWTTKVEVKYFDKIKGKGLVATEKIGMGEVVWKEDPWIIAPEWEIFRLQTSSVACTFCTTPFNSSLSPALSALPCSSSPSSGSLCPARFCNRLCLSRSSRTHPLLCPSQNPASAPLIAFAREHTWIALHALAQCTARVLMAVQTGGSEEGEKEMGVLMGFAAIGMEDRMRDMKLQGHAERLRERWKNAYELYVRAFQDPQTALDRKKLKRILIKPISEDIRRELFEYEGFLRGLGRMSLNLEAHGGLYALHSHLNHSCAPNVSVRHLDKRTILSRITIVALADIDVGDELLVTYVNPGMGVRERRKDLIPWGFGTCVCARCVAEEGEAGEAGERDDGMGDLEKELREGLGVE